jgi:hypothetical protein
MNEPDETKRGRELARRYVEIIKLRAKIMADLRRLIGLCKEFVPFLDDVRDGNAGRIGWWLGKYSPAVDHMETRRIKSLASRTQNMEHVESWQLRILGMVSSVHHKDKPLSPSRTKRRFKQKSWIYHVGKAQDEIAKQIKQLGGVDALTEEERERFAAQLEPVRVLLEQIE